MNSEQRFHALLAAFLPETTRLVVIDNGEISQVLLGPEQHWQPFISDKGKYWGPPVDDDHAILELWRAKLAGAEYVALGWMAFDWLARYPAFAAYLDTIACLEIDEPELKLYQLI